MWSLWAIAYVLGFAHDAVVHAYDPAGSHLGPVADQEITAFLLWAAAGLAFTPVVFTVLMRWLKDGSEPAGEPTRPMPGTTGVRGWGPPAPRGRPAYPGPLTGSAGQGRRSHVGGQRLAGGGDHPVDGGPLGVEHPLITLQRGGGGLDR